MLERRDRWAALNHLDFANLIPYRLCHAGGNIGATLEEALRSFFIWLMWKSIRMRGIA